MSHLHLDFTVPISLLVSAIIGVLLVRMAMSQGDKRAATKARQILKEMGSPPEPQGDGDARESLEP